MSGANRPPPPDARLSSATAAGAGPAVPPTSSCPGLARPSTTSSADAPTDVGGRHKAGHDGVGSCAISGHDGGKGPIPYVLIAAALAAAPLVLPPFAMTLLTEALILGLLAMSLDLMVG